MVAVQARRSCRRRGIIGPVMWRYHLPIKRLARPSAIPLLAFALAGFSPVPPAQAADAAACRELERRHELAKADIASLQLNSLLFAAVEKGCAPLARALLAAGASPDARDRLGNRPLALAARSGQLELVDLLLEQGAPIDARNLAGSSALYLAAENDRLGIVRRLLDRGADANVAGRTGVTRLAAAAFKGNDRIVEQLLARGAAPDAMDATGKAPIVYAAALGFTPIVRRLLDAGVVATARYGNDLTSLMWAAGYADSAGVADAKEVVALLIDRGVLVDAADDRGRTALMIAAEDGHAAIVELLIARGADRTIKDKSGKVALDLAADESVREKLKP